MIPSRLLFFRHEAIEKARQRRRGEDVGEGAPQRTTQAKNRGGNMLQTRMRRAASAVAFGLAVAMSSVASHGQDMEVIVALPAPTLTFTSHFVAEDGGFFAKEGIKVQTRTLVGVAATNALLAGSVDFTHGSGPTFLSAAAQGQALFASASLGDNVMVETVLRKDVAGRLGISETTPIAERALKLKGLTIAIQGVGSMIHAWTRFILDKGGLDVENDVRIAP